MKFFQDLIDNTLGSPKSTLFGILKGAVQAAIIAAATQYQTTGNTTDWKQYAFVAAGAAIPIITGMKRPDETPAANTTVDDQIKAALNARIQASLDDATQKAIAAIQG